MTKGEYAYPPDEFDTVERGSVPRGVHRATRSTWRRVWPFLLVIVLFPAIAYGAVSYWSGERNGTPAASSSSAGAVVPQETPAETPAETPVETPAETPVETPAVTIAPADLTTPVVVFNATTTGGLAAGAALVLTDAGWTDVTTDNFVGTETTSSVLFASAELATTAQAAADKLGIATVALDDTVTDIQVILAKDYKP
ncbi:MAG: LytR C-terminal domain-containing protein [Cellulomonas sp.]